MDKEIEINMDEIPTLVQDGTRPVYVSRSAFLAGEENEISLDRGELVLVIDKTTTGWWHVERRGGETGYVPSHYLRTPHQVFGKMQNGKEDFQRALGDFEGAIVAREKGLRLSAHSDSGEPDPLHMLPETNRRNSPNDSESHINSIDVINHAEKHETNQPDITKQTFNQTDNKKQSDDQSGDAVNSMNQSGTTDENEVVSERNTMSVRDRVKLFSGL